MPTRSIDELLRENAELRQRVEAVEATLHALQTGEANGKSLTAESTSSVKPAAVDGPVLRGSIPDDIEQALHASEQRERARAAEFETLLRALPAAVSIAHDAACSSLIGNPAMYHLLRMAEGAEFSASRSVEELTARPFREFRDGRPVPACELPMQIAAAQGIEVRGAELALVFEDGEVRHIHCNAVPLREPDGMVRGAISASVDITERKLAEQALRDADRRKDDFLAMLAHELRNPLAPIHNAMEMFRAIGSTDPSLEKACDMVDRQVNHMSRLIDELLDVARISRGKMLLRRSRCDLARIVGDAVEDQRSTLEDAGLTLRLDLPIGELWLHGDSTRLSQIVGNLLHNAGKFTNPGGKVFVRLSTAADGRTADLSVHDTGIGMSPEILVRLFEPFSQADNSLDRSRGGLGLGLALVQGLVELHGGSIEAASDGIGRGSEFSIRLPIEAIENSLGSHSASSEAKAQSLRVLVIEDNPDMAESLRMLLELAGHEVKIALRGSAGVECAVQFRPAAVLCDIGLPGNMDGYAVARALRKEPVTKRAFLLALSGYGQDEDQRRSIEAGFDMHLVKPLPFKKLRTLLNEFCTGSL